MDIKDAHAELKGLIKQGYFGFVEAKYIFYVFKDHIENGETAKMALVLVKQEFGELADA